MKKSLTDKLEARLGRFAIPNLALYLVVFQLGVFILAAFQVSPADPRTGIHIFSFVPALAFGEGELWRLFSFILLPIHTPTVGFTIGWVGALFTAIAFYIFYMMGSSLEERWGAFRFNLYVLSFVLLTVLFGFVAWLLGGGIFPADPYYLYLAVFIAFGTMYPDIEFLLFFILPVKVKWLAVAAFTLTAIAAIGAGNLWELLAFGAVVGTYGIFFGQHWLFRARSAKRRATYEKQVRSVEGEAFHRCDACGRTDITDPDRDFRYIKKDGESFCYCANFLQTGEKCPPLDKAK